MHKSRGTILLQSNATPSHALRLSLNDLDLGSVPTYLSTLLEFSRTRAVCQSEWVFNSGLSGIPASVRHSASHETSA